MTRNNEGLFGGNGAWFIVLILFFLGGMGNWGNRGDSSSSVQGALTRAELYDGLNSQNTFSEFRQIQNEVNNGLNFTNQNINNGFSTTALALNNGFNGVQSSIADTRYAMQDCCCQIKTAIHQDGELTRGLIQQNIIQELRDKVADKDREILATGLVTAQTIQTNNLENFIRSIVSSSSSSSTTTTTT